MRKISRKAPAAGLPPGSLVHVGERKTEEAKITLFDYDEDGYQEKQVETIEECFPFKETSTVTWINVSGLHQVDIVEKIGSHFDLHPLLLEDILNTGQRPKMEDFENYLFVVLKMLGYREDKSRVTAEQVSLILGPNFVLSFQEQLGDVFDPVRDRIRKGKGRMRKRGPDYLAYALFDTIVDNYFIVLEKFGERIEALEEELLTDPSLETLQAIHDLKRETILLKKSIWPLRELISGLERTESPLIKDSTGAFLRDVYDHTIQVIDTIETFREMISGLLDLYISSISNKMNEVMKVLTIIATIFIPITFIAGIYGMNFENMPELAWGGSYYVALFAMFVVAMVMVGYFRKKEWL